MKVKKEGPEISVVMPTYNGSKHIEKAIESVIEQTYTNWELIIVDDCSTDNTIDIVRKYCDEDARIRIIRKEKNDGVAVTRNIGINAASGRTIALLDCDDVWVNNKLERQLNLQKRTNAEIVYCSYGFIDENDKHILRPFIVPEETNFEHMLVSSVISCSTALIDAELLKQHPFNAEYYHEDYVLWMELLSGSIKAVGNTEVLAYYRQVDGSRANNKINAAKQRWLIYRKVLHLGTIKSLSIFVQYALCGIKKYADKNNRGS